MPGPLKNLAELTGEVCGSSGAFLFWEIDICWFRVWICRGPFGAILANLEPSRPHRSTRQGLSLDPASHESSLCTPTKFSDRASRCLRGLPRGHSSDLRLVPVWSVSHPHVLAVELGRSHFVRMLPTRIIRAVCQLGEVCSSSLRLIRLFAGRETREGEPFGDSMVTTRRSCRNR